MNFTTMTAAEILAIDTTKMEAKETFLNGQHRMVRSLKDMAYAMCSSTHKLLDSEMYKSATWDAYKALDAVYFAHLTKWSEAYSELQEIAKAKKSITEAKSFCKACGKSCDYEVRYEEDSTATDRGSKDESGYVISSVCCKAEVSGDSDLESEFMGWSPDEVVH